MKKLKSSVINIHKRIALPCLSDEIIQDFTSVELNPFRPQRYPPEVEVNLREALLSGIISPERLLMEYVNTQGEKVAFVLTERSEHGGVTVLLAGVWPAFRGRGVFRGIIDNILVLSGEPVAVLCHPDMTIAIRQIAKLGFRPQNTSNYGMLYARQTLNDIYEPGSLPNLIGGMY